MSFFNNVVIWGHKLHSHTHSYIHYGFDKTFKHMGYETHWVDNNDNISNIDLSRALFITEGQVDGKIPLLPGAYYVLHNCNMDKYKDIPDDHKMVLQVYTHDTYKKHEARPVEGKKFTYWKDNCLFQPWSADLLPHEIDENINKLAEEGSQYGMDKNVYFVGTPTHVWTEFSNVCRKHNIIFRTVRNISPEENIRLIRASKIAPSLQCDWQCENGYIPCRIFKNISYGRYSAANNPTVQELFDGRIFYSNNLEDIIDESIKFENMNDKLDLIKELMIDVRDNHTYINRINTIIWFMENHIINS